MRKILFMMMAIIAISFASCGNGSKGNNGKSMSAADSIRLQDSIDAVMQTEQEALEIQQAEAAAEQAAQEAAKAGRGSSANR